jgi:Ig-like domain from next to BRCA1 gene
MNHLSKKVLPGFILSLAILTSACSFSTSSTARRNATYASAAQTTVSQEVSQDVTNQQLATDQSAIPSPTTVPSPTNLPTATSTPVATTYTGPVCDNSIYISDVTIPDNTVVAAGQTFVKTWMFQNTGTCTWNTNYTLTYVGGSQMGGTNTSVGGSVAPGQQAELSVTLTAPTATGQYTGYWRLFNASGETFGEQVDVLINVGESAVVPTFTPALTPTP